jgi:hypothetical protein
MQLQSGGLVYVAIIPKNRCFPGIQINKQVEYWGYWGSGQFFSVLVILTSPSKIIFLWLKKGGKLNYRSDGPMGQLWENIGRTNSIGPSSPEPPFFRLPIVGSPFSDISDSVG